MLILTLGFWFCYFGFKCSCLSSGYFRGCPLGKGWAQNCLQGWWVRCILYAQVQYGTTFVGTPQYGYGIKQAWMPIYSRGRPKHQDHMAMNV
jgi:hypothetical protein